MSTGKILAVVFWNKGGIILLDLLEKARTIIGIYYRKLLCKLRKRIVKDLPKVFPICKTTPRTTTR